ncbi:Nuclear pore complex protein NUP133 [Linum perenne]
MQKKKIKCISKTSPSLQLNSPHFFFSIPQNRHQNPKHHHDQALSTLTMFSPAAKRSTFSSHRDGNLGQSSPVLAAAAAAPRSPFTPLPDNRKSVLFDNNATVPDRPATGTPAPWASPRLSVLARIPPTGKAEKGSQEDPIKPVYVGEFPQAVRDEQFFSGDTLVSGGMDKLTCLSWIICGSKVYVWSYLSSAASKKCTVLELPSDILQHGDIGKSSNHDSSWSLSVVAWGGTKQGGSKGLQTIDSVGIVMCNQKTRAIVYWPEINAEGRSVPDARTTFSRQRQRSRSANSSTKFHSLNSLIATAVPVAKHVCVAFACCSNGELWQFTCSPTGVEHRKVYHDSGKFVGSKGYPRSLVWRFSTSSTEDSNREFFMLTDQEVKCFSVTFNPVIKATEIWSHEIVCSDGDLGIKKDLAGQKRIWPLDAQVDERGKVITILVAIFCMDRVSSSSYTQYSLLTMQYNSQVSRSSDYHEQILEKKAPIQEIIPKARLEEEDFLFSMRLRVGGKPAGSAIILSGDGTATVSHYYRSKTRLYQFDLPYDAGKVLDASVLPSADDGEDGAWVILTEKAGIWAIPEKAVVLGGVEPPERSLSRKGSSNERSSQEEKRNVAFAGAMAPRRVSSAAWDVGDRQRAAMTGIVRSTVQDEESEALLSQVFHDFLLTGQVDSLVEKLRNSGAFDRDGETNVFARTSKSIVDTLAKHWTTTRGVEIVSMSIVSNQLMDKQQKHDKFLQFLALSKCHEELSSKQRQSLLTILEHGEKLDGMIHLRELQNTINQNRATSAGMLPGSEVQISGALWDLIQLVGERTRRNTVLLMDRDNAEVFFSKVSDLEELFHCLDRHLEYILNEDQPLEFQIQRASELSNVIVSIFRAAAFYRDEHHMWYPPPEGLTPWNCQPVVRNGMWRVASFMVQLLNETSRLADSAKFDFHSHLEVLTEVLLEAYAGAIEAKLGRGEEHKGISDEYWKRRDFLLDSLYHQVKYLVEGKHEVLAIETGGQQNEILRKLSSSLLSIAKRHEAYNIMWSICCDFNDSELLKKLMHESMGPKGGFSYFVFKQLYEKRQFAKLLRLGEEFQQELSIFLKDHQDLLWLHELFLHQFSSASENLHTLALSQDECSIPEDDEDAVNDRQHPGIRTTVADRKRLLNLSKIGAMAGKNVDYESKVKRIEADLKILKLQDILTTDEPELHDKTRLLRPEELIELCLKSGRRDLALHAFDIFAWTSSSFRESHRSLLEDCWKNAANQDNWGELQRANENQGWSDEEMLNHLRGTVLFQASSRCYGAQGEMIEEEFEAVLPLRKDDPGGGAEYSVETLLMQHSEYPDAGKLMLTAAVLGAVQEDVKVDETCPME